LEIIQKEEVQIERKKEIKKTTDGLKDQGNIFTSIFLYIVDPPKERIHVQSYDRANVLSSHLLNLAMLSVM
jgi:hypothetical protein